MTILSGKVAVVIGGSGGIGAAAARMLATEGATVVVTWRSGEAAATTLAAGLRDAPDLFDRLDDRRRRRPGAGRRP